MYKLINESTVQRLSDNAFIPFDKANTDYTQFKSDIANGAELQDAEGQVMTKEQVEEFMRGIP
jgi:hypothetical protein